MQFLHNLFLMYVIEWSSSNSQEPANFEEPGGSTVELRYIPLLIGEENLLIVNQ
jgi:hypothetical protein